MTNQGVNFQLPSGGQFSVAVDMTAMYAEIGPRSPAGGMWLSQRYVRAAR
jgi:hypothetical protein